MNNKFKVGDKVRLNGNGNPVGYVVKKSGRYLCYFKGFHGHSDGGQYPTKEYWYADDCDLELVERLNKTIIIYRNGSETVAIDKSTGEIAIATCSPDDEYDFRVGAKLAFDILVAPKYLNTKIIFTKGDCIFKTGKVYEIKDGRINIDGTIIPKYTEPFKTLEDAREFFHKAWDFDRKLEFIEGDKLPEPEYKVGDCVKAVNTGQSYTTYSEFFRDNNIDIDIAARYVYGRPIIEHNKTYEVLAIGEHKINGKKLLVVREYDNKYFHSYSSHEVSIIGVDGVEKV